MSRAALRVGLVCPYSLDVPGGVQAHVLGLAEQLARRGCLVSVLAPGQPREEVAGVRVVSAGRAVPVPFNGSVARITPGPVAARAARRWLAGGVAGGPFDLVHVHEPTVPSVSMVVARAAQVPVVATFHAALAAPWVLDAGRCVVGPVLRRVDVALAVSRTAAETIAPHLRQRPVVVPNGIQLPGDSTRAGRRVRAAAPPRVVALGRMGEPRKGLDVLLAAARRIGARAEVVIAGPVAGIDVARARDAGVTVLGPVPEADKEALVGGATVFVAPHTSGESFGIVLLEALRAGAPVVASDIPAFREVLADGGAGILVPPGDPDALAGAITGLLEDAEARAGLVDRGLARVADFAWPVVTDRVLDAYRRTGVPVGVEGSLDSPGPTPAPAPEDVQ